MSVTPSDTRGFPPRRGALQVTVVVDRPDRARGEFWRDAFRQMQQRLPTEVICRAVSNDVRVPLDQQEASTLACLQQSDVCVVNWDAVNDDPDFGADLVRKWFEHRSTAVLDWVFAGGILILEGQANLAVPTQQAYDAVVGHGELRVCGAEDPLDARKQELRVGRRCQLTRKARNTHAFGSLPRDLTARGDRAHDDMFPPASAGRLVALRSEQWPLLYRGWFHRQRLRRRRFGWVSLIKTAGHRPRNHPTLLVSRVGEGAIFASTMLLSSSKQFGLIEAMFKTHGRTHELPAPWRLTTFFANHKLDVILPLLVAVLLGLSSRIEPFRRWFDVPQDPWQDLKKVGVTTAVLLLLAALGLRRRLVKYLRDFWGY